jgi:dihydrodipicolinate synthase/N-acetylneuraminate lyase
MAGEAEFFSGIVVPMVSPFTTDGHIDVPAVSRLVSRLVAAGVQGIFVLGTTGEGVSMQRYQRSQIVYEAAAAIARQGKKVALYAGISGNCVAESLESAEIWKQAGADAVVAHPPFYFPISDSMLEKYFQELGDRSPLPLLLYNIPQTTNISIPLETISRLSKHPNIIGIKDSQRDLPRLSKLIEEHRDSAFRVLAGSISLACACLKIGAHGLVPSTANFAPEIYVGMFNAARAGNWAEADKLQAESDRLSAQYQQGVSLGESIAKLKLLMSQQGICSPHVLPPLQTQSETCG